MSRAEDDEIERVLAAQREAEVAREARALTGHEVKALREALALSRTALGRINTKGLSFAVQRDVINARLAIERAQPMVAWRAPHTRGGRLRAAEAPSADKDPTTPSAGTAG